MPKADRGVGSVSEGDNTNNSHDLAVTKIVTVAVVTFWSDFGEGMSRCLLSVDVTSDTVCLTVMQLIW